MNRCSCCLMPDTRPDTAFFGRKCSACIAYENRPEIDWEAKRDELLAILDRPKTSEYDCIVPSSGGKDSSWQVLTLLELGANPLVVTASTCHLTPIGRRNIDNLAKYADTIEVTPNREVRAKLNRLSLEMVGDPSWPEHVLINAVPFRVAIDMGIPLVFYGENPLTQYGSPTKERQDEQRMTRRWIAEFGGQLGLRPADFIGTEGITQRDMAVYCGPTDAGLEEAGIEVYFLGQFLPWDSRRNATVAIDHGFKAMLPSSANWWTAENLDNAQTGLHDHFGYLKYGYGRACAQLSVDIRAGVITRKAGLSELKHRDGVFPEEYAGVPIGDVLERIGMSRGRLDELMVEYTRCP